MKRLLLICGTALLLAPAALAAPSSPTLVASPDTVTLGTASTLSGCGYRAGSLVRLTVSQDWVALGQYVIPDSTGCFALSWTFDSPYVAGPVTVTSQDASNTGGRPKGKVLASLVVQLT